MITEMGAPRAVIKPITIDRSNEVKAEFMNTSLPITMYLDIPGRRCHEPCSNASVILWVIMD